MSVCTDVVPTTSKAFCTCHRGWLHDLGNKFEMYGLPETTELTEYDLNYGNALYSPWGKPSANCWIWGIFNKRNKRPTTKIIGWQSRPLFKSPDNKPYLYTYVALQKCPLKPYIFLLAFLTFTNTSRTSLSYSHFPTETMVVKNALTLTALNHTKFSYYINPRPQLLVGNVNSKFPFKTKSIWSHLS